MRNYIGKGKLRSISVALTCSKFTSEVIKMFPSRGDDPLTAVLQQIVEEEKGLVDTAPVLLVVLQKSFPQHSNRLGKSLVGKSEGGNFLHLNPTRAPGVIICCFANLSRKSE